jgi:hypothetical protein
MCAQNSFTEERNFSYRTKRMPKGEKEGIK